MPDLDLYKIYGLDRRAPSEALAAQLTAQLNTAPDQLARQRLDVARAILGDPQRRARYDAQLDDPNASAITEQALAALSGRPALSQPQARLMAVVAAAIGLLLVIVVSAVACTGGSDAEGPASVASEQTGQTTTTAEEPELELDSARISESTTGSVPEAQLKIVKQVSLADQPGMTSDRPRVIQLNDETVRAYWKGESTYLKADGYHEGYTESWVDLTIADDGASLTPDGQTGSERIVPTRFEPGEPIPAGALKGMPWDAGARASSGMFYFAEGAPGKYPWKTSDEDKPHHREVLSAIEQGRYVYLTVDGFPGVLIAELEKT